MKKTYIYFSNPFLVIGAKNFKKGVKLSKKTYNELKARQADPFYGAQYAIYAPFHEALMKAYNEWKAQGGIQKGSTLTFKQLLKLLPKKMRGFSALIESTNPPQFEKDSPDYITLFNNGMEPFGTNKSIETRMTALGAFSVALENFTALAGVKTLFDTYLETLTTAQSNQESNVGATGTDSDTVKEKVIAAMEELYGVMGAGINKFKKDATVLENIFAMQVLRDHRQLIFNGTLEANEKHNIMEHTFDEFDELKLTAKETRLGYYLALNAFDGPAGYTIITVDANTSKTVDASVFTNLDTNKFLCVINMEAIVGHFTVKLI